jgi:hypothetical protein
MGNRRLATLLIFVLGLAIGACAQKREHIEVRQSEEVHVGDPQMVSPGQEVVE